MASRTMFVGDTYPDVYLQVTDETGVLNLATASSIAVKFDGQTHNFSGPGVSIWPATVDPDGIHHWNLHYVFASGDTAFVDVYAIWVVVTWSTGPPAEIETFSTGDTLTVKAAPV